MARSGGRSPVRRTTLGDVQQQLAQGWPAGLTVLTGDDLYHLDCAQRAILSELAPGQDSEFALTVYGEQRIDIATVVAAARSVGPAPTSMLGRQLDLVFARPTLAQRHGEVQR